MDRQQGLADAGRERVAPMVLGAWDAFLAQAAEVDLDRPSRLPGWRAREICTHLGCWPDHAAVSDLIASARAGAEGAPPDVDAVNARVTAAHRDASRDEVLEALRSHREVVRRYFADEPAELDTAPTVSVVGRLPLLGVLLGEAYELAVHGLDLVSCGAAPPPPEVLQSGIAALVDITGALVASCGIDGRVTLTGPDGGWGFVSDATGWEVHRVPSGRPGGPAVEGDAGVLLDAAAGRINPVPAVAMRRLRLYDVGGLLKLTPIVEYVPGIPGGPILRLAARTVGGAGGLLGRLLRRG